MITIVSGTNRDGSNSLKIAQHLESVYRDAGQTVRLLDLSQLPPEALLPDAYSNKSDDFTKAFIEPVLQANGLHIVVPEYNGSFPGVLKLFVDLLPFPDSFEGRPVAFVGLAAGANGALRPVEQLQMVFAYRNAYLFNRRVFIPAVYKALNGQGELSDADLIRRLSEQVSGFVEFCQRLRAG